MGLRDRRLRFGPADPKIATSHYGRGLARVNKGDSTGANADIAAAKAIKPAIAEEFAQYGVQ